jgi:ribosomal-protein-alanine N-acetyltransferase
MAAVHSAAFSERQRWRADDIAALLAQPGVTGAVDPDGGFVLVRVVADEAEILTLAVVPALRRSGRGRALLAAAHRIAAAGGASRVFLEVMDGNSAAKTLYESAGYREVGRRSRYYADGADAVLLRLDLTPGAAERG